MKTFALSCLITKSTCQQSKIVTCIGLIVTNKKNLLKLSDSIETGLFDHHHHAHINHNEVWKF